MITQESACLDISKSTYRHPLNRHHYNLQKFESALDEEYKVVRDTCVRLAKDARRFLYDQSKVKLHGYNTSTVPFRRDLDFVDRGDILSQIGERGSRPADNAYIRSLHFPEISQRQEEIKDAYKRTFQWIFDETGKAVRPWSNFIDWLVKGSGTYWINGKPGSGKSTLIGYISQDPRTKSALLQWAGSKELLTPTFFFWAAGTNLQQSIIGLLRSLNYQILSQSSILSKLPDLCATSTVWTERKLLDLFLNLIENSSQSHCFCLFIDGLDELNGDRYELLQFILDVSRRQNVKFCLSSRPERPFQNLGIYSQLRLQDLTRSDIKEYITFELRKFTNFRGNLKGSLLIDQMVAKADGVFLWVRLAVKSQILGIDYEDSFELLCQRLDSLPTEIEGLYSNMLQRIDPIHYEEAAGYLKTALLLQSQQSFIKRDIVPNIFFITLAKYSLTEDLRLIFPTLDTGALTSKCAYTKSRIDAICAGFLESSTTSVVEEDEWLDWEQKSAHEVRPELDYNKQTAMFCHRTALDFFKDQR